MIRFQIKNIETWKLIKVAYMALNKLRNAGYESKVQESAHCPNSIGFFQCQNKTLGEKDKSIDASLTKHKVMKR